LDQERDLAVEEDLGALSAPAPASGRWVRSGQEARLGPGVKRPRTVEPLPLLEGEYAVLRHGSEPAVGSPVEQVAKVDQPLLSALDSSARRGKRCTGRLRDRDVRCLQMAERDRRSGRDAWEQAVDDPAVDQESDFAGPFERGNGADQLRKARQQALGVAS
jgi:hypothetical protein